MSLFTKSWKPGRWVTTPGNNVNEVILRVHKHVELLAGKGYPTLSWNSGGSSSVKFDKDRIFQVLMNLMVNAIKYSEKGISSFGRGAKRMRSMSVSGTLVRALRRNIWKRSLSLLDRRKTTGRAVRDWVWPFQGDHSRAYTGGSGRSRKLEREVRFISLCRSEDLGSV